MPLPLEDILVVSLEQAVAAPYCSCRLADAGARVIKIERPEGDFAREYDELVHGESAYFVWLNRGKESVTLDLTNVEDTRLMLAMVAKADVFIQNLKPGAIDKLGLSISTLRAMNPRLIVCSLSGYGDIGPFASRKAYDLLIQAESGMASITGSAEAPARVGVSIVDIGTGISAYAAILEALHLRRQTGEGSVIEVSMFDAMADWLSVPLLQHEYGKSPQRLGLAHPSIAPYGVFQTRDNVPVLLSIQNDREWQVFARKVMANEEAANDARFARNIDRVRNRDATDAIVGAFFRAHDMQNATMRLAEAEVAFGVVNDMAGLSGHPHLRRIKVGTPTGPVSYPAPPARWGAATRDFGPVPGLGQDTSRIRSEFGQNGGQLL
jgi:itaconate CoA-transferase